MNETLALYEEQQRRKVHYYGMRTEQTPDVVRVVAQDEGEGAVIFSRLDESSADRVIREQIAYFEGIGQDFEWKVFSYDTPSDLRERLIACGFESEEPESIMVLDLETAPAALFAPVTADVRRITDPAQINQVVQILNQVWNDDHETLGDILAEELTHYGDYLSIYLAYADGIPASAAWIRFHEGSQFAGLWGGSSLAAYRQRGLYTALVSVRAQEARRRGVRYLTIDASPMSQPIVTKYGFQLLAVAHACKWTVKRHQR
jgi:hypothetical protein